jgi:SAM-dependent methyltransferase
MINLLMLKRLIKKIIYPFRRKYTLYGGLIIPASHMRFCGNKFKSNKYFVDSAQKQVDKLINLCKLTYSSKILDIGCGVGRLAIGILSKLKEIKLYQGIDIDKKSIIWCEKYINKNYPSFQFNYINIYNSRYNKKGLQLDRNFHFPVREHKFNIIYLYSVFSHMIENDIRIYLNEFNNLLSLKGKIFMTGFFENDVPNMMINPDNYRMKWQEPLHCVRYNKSYFEAMLKEYGFTIEYFEYETETDGQSVIIVSN